MATFLSAQEVETLTGKAQKAAQARWLQAKGYYFEVNGNGDILIGRDYINSRFSGARKNATEPNFGWMR